MNLKKYVFYLIFQGPDLHNDAIVEFVNSMRHPIQYLNYLQPTLRGWSHFYLSEEGLNVEVAILYAPSRGIASPKHCRLNE